MKDTIKKYLEKKSFYKPDEINFSQNNFSEIAICIPVCNEYPTFMNTLKFDLKDNGKSFKLLNATNGGPWHKRHANDQWRSNFEAYKNARIPYSISPKFVNAYEISPSRPSFTKLYFETEVPSFIPYPPSAAPEDSIIAFGSPS